MKQILLIRHGESEANAGLKTTVPAEVALTERGWAQARAVANFIFHKPSLIVISPYLRTKQTAQPLIDKSPAAAVETWAIQEFTYLATERCRGTDYLDRKPLVEEFWRRNEPEFCDGAGAESFAAFWRRTQAAVARITHDLPDGAVIFCHAQVMRAMLWLLLREHEPTKDLMLAFYFFMKAVTIPNAAMVKILIAEDSTEVFTGIISTAHLPPQLQTA